MQSNCDKEMEIKQFKTLNIEKQVSFDKLNSEVKELRKEREK